MNEPVISMGADGVDTRRVVAEIQAEVDENIQSGLYADAVVARAERLNLAPGREEGAFLEYYLRCLPDAVVVDIGDFEIRERRARFAPLLIRLKRAIWNLLKFYTYRLWSQQNQVNGMIATAIERMDDQHRLQIERLEQRIRALESGREPPSNGPGPGPA
ncbi:MAG: hypothetical protein KBA51_00255 [Kiritimatiellae bacterium]|nr:hypothetical protein [Kiritimatiellia bacterium]